MRSGAACGDEHGRYCRCGNGGGVPVAAHACRARQPKESDTSSSSPWYQSKPAAEPGLPCAPTFTSEGGETDPMTADVLCTITPSIHTWMAEPVLMHWT